MITKTLIEMIKAVMFDYGGVVTNETYAEIEKITSDMLGVNLNGIRKKIGESLSKFESGTISEQDFWQELTDKKTNLPRDLFHDFWIREYFKRVKIHENVLQLVDELKKNGYKVGLISNTIMPHVREIRKRGGYKRFDPVILSCEVGFRKPKREIYEIALKKLGLKPEECVFVDDLQENVEGAKTVGIKAFLFEGVKQFKKDLLSCGVKL